MPNRRSRSYASCFRPTPRPGAAAVSREYDERSVMRAWERFLEGRETPKDAAERVRGLIRESWSRSAGAGIDAEKDAAPLAPDPEMSPEMLRHRNRRLLAAAQDSIGRIGKLLNGRRAILILTDNTGVIFEAVGDRETLEDARDINLEIGGVWDERAIGTNGIGTALSAGAPVFVHAAEHFCSGIKAWTFAGAPIHDPLNNSVLGVVDLSGPPDIFQRHNTALVTAAACEIEASLAERQIEDRLRLLEAFHDTVPVRGSEDAYVILDQYGRVVYRRNTANSAVFDELKDEVTFGQRLLELSDEMTDADIVAAAPETLRPRGAVPLSHGGEFRGAALILPTEHRVAPSHTPAARPSARTRVKGHPTIIVGESPALLEAVDMAQRVSRGGASVLIQGETGVGKELFARLVHSEARDAEKSPFIAINCGGIARELFGSELFGHVAGAFTGASPKGKPGKFELADGGVLRLDEIGEMPLDKQPFLLRVLEQRAVYRIGDGTRRPVDVQLVALTNRDLRREVEAGLFRNDLYYRISTVTIHVLGLRERREDIPLLVAHFNARIAADLGQDPLRISDAVMEALCAHHWRGNVRELRNLLERLHLLARSPEIRMSDLPAEITRPAPAPAPTAQPQGSGCATRPPAAAAPEGPARAASLEETERAAIKTAIDAERGNMTRVAKALGISRPTLYRKMKLYGIRRVYD